MNHPRQTTIKTRLDDLRNAINGEPAECFGVSERAGLRVSPLVSDISTGLRQPPPRRKRQPVAKPEGLRFDGTRRTPEVTRGLSQYVSRVTQTAIGARCKHCNNRTPANLLHHVDKAPGLATWLLIGAVMLGLGIAAYATASKPAAVEPERAIYSLDTGAAQ